MQACDRCHSRKTRCDRRIPLCGACEKAGTPCLHTDKLRQRNVPRGYIDSMEKRVQELTRENAKLQLQLQNALRIAPAPDRRCEREPTHSSTTSSPILRSASSQPARANSEAPHDNATFHRDSSESNAFARELGLLSLAATGETRYLGSGAGIHLANLISKVIISQNGMSSPVEFSISDGPIQSRPATPSTDCRVPSLTDATPLIDSYFEHTHLIFPLLHEPSFMAIVDQIYNDPQFYESHPYEAFVFDMVLAIGASNSNRPESTTKASAHQSRAESKAQDIMTMEGLKILRAILLVCHYSIFSNLGDTSASIWHLVGIGARLCFEQGLHLQRGRFTAGEQNLGQGSNVIMLEEEMKKRCFWCLYNLDRVVSFTLGRPFIIRDEEIDITLPSGLPDEDLSAEVSSQLHTDPGRTPFLHLIRIRQISGKILNTFHNARQELHVSVEQRRQTRQELHQQLLAWKEDTKHLDLTAKRPNQRYVSTFLTKEWYDVVYHNAMLLLYRPSTQLPHPAIEEWPAGGGSDLMILLASATASIESYGALRHMRRLNCSWITLHGCFLAGVAYIYCVGRLLRDSQGRKSTPDLLSIIETTRACSNVLVAICERYNISRRSCDLFDKLSNAIIVDTLEANARSPNTQNDQQDQRFPGEGSVMIDNSPLEHGALGATPQLDQLLDVDEFRHYAASLGPANLRQPSFPRDFMMGSPLDWPLDMTFDENGTLDSSMRIDETQMRGHWPHGTIFDNRTAD